jgi:hypothetical protein
MKIEAPELNVYIRAEAQDKIDQWVKMAKGEVSGLGLVEELEDGFIVTQVFLPFQECGQAGTTIESESVARLMLEVEAQGHDSSKLKFWWHSHANMAVFWSDTDHKTIQKFRPRDYFLSAVFNKHGQAKTRIDYYQPFRITFQDVPLINVMPDFGQTEQLKEIFEERVSEGGTSYSFGYAIDPEWFDLTHEELINKVSTGEIEWDEAEEILIEQQYVQTETEYWKRRWEDVCD